MKITARSAKIILLSILICYGCGHENNFTRLTGPYLGQNPPGIIPVIFAPGLISTHYDQSYIAFLQEARVCVFSSGTEKGHETYFTYEKGGRWTKPRKAPFEELQGHPNYTTGPLGRKVYFHSGRPTHPNDTLEEDNIWTIEWTGSGWAEPVALPEPASSEYGEAYPSASADGTVYFFTWNRPGTKGDDIWFSHCVNGEYQEAERLPWPVNTDFIEYDPYVAPDESFMIFASSRPGGYGKTDNYICFRKSDGSWTSPVNMGQPYNSSSFDQCANGTPDGKYFFFMSGRKTDINKGKTGWEPGQEPGEDSDLYWADFSFINELRNIVLVKKNAANIIRREYKENGIEDAIHTMNVLYSEHCDSIYFPPFELLTLTKLMLEERKTDDADQFCSALYTMLPKDLSIKEGYACICAMNGYVSKSFKIFEKLESEDPNFNLSEALSDLGYLLTLYQDRTRDALSVLQFTVEKFPEDPWAYYSLARVYRKLGDLDQAIKNCRKALEIRPSVGDVSQLLERLQAEKEQEQNDTQTLSFLNLTGPYLGQKPPGMTPELFAPGIISTGKEHSATMFTPDGTEAWFGRMFPNQIYFSKEVKNKWTEPQIASFCDDFNYLYPVLSPDGNSIYFTSDRPVTQNGKPLSSGEGNIWVVERIIQGWGNPKYLDQNINFSASNSCGSLSKFGNLFFTAKTISQSTDLFFSERINGSYTSGVNLKKVNSASPDHCPFVAPDESYLIFSSFRGGLGRSDLFICFRNRDGTWTEPRNMGQVVNSEWKDEYPYVTPDGKYLFFNSNRPSSLNQEPIEDGPGNIYWVDAKIIEEFKPDELE